MQLLATFLHSVRLGLARSTRRLGAFELQGTKLYRDNWCIGVVGTVDVFELERLGWRLKKLCLVFESWANLASPRKIKAKLPDQVKPSNRGATIQFLARSLVTGSGHVSAISNPSSRIKACYEWLVREV